MFGRRMARCSMAGLHCVPCRIAWCPAGESHCVRPPNGAMLDRGIALCSPAGLHGARPAAWILLPCRMARYSTAGLYSVRPPEKWRFLRYANARSTRSGGREPADHGGLTPPALALLCECPPAKNDFCDAQTQVQPRAAGVSPPWFGHPNVVRPESRNVRRLANTESRAAGVSPPWVLRKCTCRNAAAKSRETAIGAFTNPGAVAVAKPRGAYAPRSWLHGVGSPMKWRFLRYANASSQERRA
jgi:hypothetical protein